MIKALARQQFDMELSDVVGKHEGVLAKLQHTQEKIKEITAKSVFFALLLVCLKKSCKLE